jgi:hypothetical protein
MLSTAREPISATANPTTTPTATSRTDAHDPGATMNWRTATLKKSISAFDKALLVKLVK